MHLIITREGAAIDVTKPCADDIDIIDIAAGLAGVCLAPGRTARPITVAEFAIAMSETMLAELRIDDPAAELAALLALAQVAYVPALDPMQAPLWGPELTGTCMHLQRAIAKRFGLLSANAGYANEIKAAYMHTEAALVRDLLATHQSLSLSMRDERQPASGIRFDRNRYQEGHGVWMNHFLAAFARISSTRITRCIPTNLPAKQNGATHAG